MKILDYKIFPHNYFFRQYVALIERCKASSTPEGYAEQHHVFPKAIYGDNSDIVRVTYRQHVVLHYLLWRGFAIAASQAAEASSSFAVRRMVGNGVNTSCGRCPVDASDVRLAYKALSMIKWSTAARSKISSKMKEKWKDPEYRARMSRAHSHKANPDTVAKRKATIASWSPERIAAERKKLSEAVRASGKAGRPPRRTT